jgi:hypothetical protein
MRAIVVCVALLALSAAPAWGDWSGDGHADVLGQNAAGQLLMYRGNGAGAWVTGSGEPIGGGGWTFSSLLFPGDFSGDGKPDLLAIDAQGRMLMYRGDGAGAFQGTAQTVGSGWTFPYVLAPDDFSGDGRPDVLAVASDGRLVMYRGDGDGGWITGSGETIGCCGWAAFTAVFAGGDFSGDGKPDVLARSADGTLVMYRGNGAGGWVTGTGEAIGSGWGPFTALLGGGDFDGDGKADVLAEASDGHLFLYRGNGASGWILGRGEPLGEGWSSLSALTLVPGAPPAPPPPPPAPPAAPVPGARVQVKAGKHCTLPGARMRVRVRVRRIRGRAAPHVRLIVFYVPGGSRRVDHHPPYVVHLRMNLPAGDRGHVYARVYYTRGSSHRLRHRTVSRRFRICG